MKDKEIFAQILGIAKPWRVASIDLRKATKEIVIFVVHERGNAHTCPKCGSSGPGYDSRKRRWRHLDTCDLRTIIEADVPRMTCPEHGIVMVQVPWAEANARFTALFEAYVIDWLKDATVSAVARNVKLSWTAVSNIMGRAVKRGLERRKDTPCEHICVDETSFKKGHVYITVVSDARTGTVLHVAERRTKEAFKGWLEGIDEDHLAAIETVSMDMSQAYISAALEVVPDAAEKICFDKFHVAKSLGEAVDRVRREENKKLISEGIKDLTGTKYHWLRNPEKMSQREWKAFEWLREGSHKTARAWAIKELGMSIWHYVSRGWALKAWNKWYSWAIRSRLEPIKKVARMIKRHLWGIINAVVHGVSNGPAESINSRIKAIKVKCRGFRNQQRFANAQGERPSPYFHLGGLNLYPEGAR